MLVYFLKTIQKCPEEEKPKERAIFSIEKFVSIRRRFASLVWNLALYSNIVILVACIKHLQSQVFDKAYSLQRSDNENFL